AGLGNRGVSSGSGVVGREYVGVALDDGQTGKQCGVVERRRGLADPASIRAHQLTVVTDGRLNVSVIRRPGLDDFVERKASSRRDDGPTERAGGQGRIVPLAVRASVEAGGKTGDLNGRGWGFHKSANRPPGGDKQRGGSQGH